MSKCTNSVYMHKELWLQLNSKKMHKQKTINAKICSHSMYKNKDKKKKNSTSLE